MKILIFIIKVNITETIKEKHCQEDNMRNARELIIKIKVTAKFSICK